MKRSSLTVAPLLLFTLAAAAHARPEFAGMGNVPLESGSAPLTWLKGVNNKGVVIGTVYQNIANEKRAARWSAATGYQRLNTLAIDGSADASGIAQDSNIISVNQISEINPVVNYWYYQQFNTTALIGTSHGITANGAKLLVSTPSGPGTWSFAFGFEPLYVPPEVHSADVTDFSDDGSVILGEFRQENGDRHAVIWAAGTYLDLHSLLGVNDYQATAISGDGSTVVGLVFDAVELIAKPFRWTLAEGIQYIPLPPDAAPMDPAGASDVNFDGTVIVGLSASVSASRPARTDQPMLLIHPSRAGTGVEYEPFIWTASAGSRRVETILEAGGTSLPFGWNLESAEKVSSNGRYIVGIALHEIPSLSGPQPETWFIDLATAPPPPCDGDADHNGAVNFADITSVLAQFNTVCP